MPVSMLTSAWGLAGLTMALQSMCEGDPVLVAAMLGYDPRASAIARVHQMYVSMKWCSHSLADAMSPETVFRGAMPMRRRLGRMIATKTLSDEQSTSPRREHRASTVCPNEHAPAFRLPRICSALAIMSSSGSSTTIPANTHKSSLPTNCASCENDLKDAIQ